MKTSKFLLKVSVTAVALAIPQLAGAAIEEIIVTAQKRSESLQEIPVAVTAFTGKTIEQQRITDLGVIASKTPNFSIGQQSPTQPELTIRGIGSTDREAGSERSVVVFVDHVYIGRAGASTFDFFDLERIEVLRGPQGTLYGRNVVGGAVNLITNRASHDFGGKAQVTGGSDSLAEAKGVVTGGLTDNLAGRASFSFTGRDGFYHNNQFDKDSNDLQTSSLRGQLLYEPGDSLSARFTLEYSKDEVDGVASKITQGEASDEDFAAALAPFGAYVPDSDIFATDNNKFGDIERDSVALYAQVDWTLASGNVLTFLPAYRINNLDEFRDLAGIPLVGSGPDSKGFESTAINEEEYTAASVELRLASGDENSALQWIAGLYYSQEDIDRTQIRERQANTSFSRPLFDQQVVSTSYAAFGELSFDITDTVTIAGGIRYTDDDKDFDVEVSNTLSAAEQAAIEAELGRATSLNPATEEYITAVSDGWEKVTYKLSLDWQITDDFLLYAIGSTGYKSGGFNGLAASQELAELSFFEETVENIEIGFKGAFFDNRLQTNLNVFKMDFEDLQLRDRQLLIPGDETSAVITIVNAGKAENKGVEFEFIFEPIDNLTFDGNFAVLDTEIVEVEDGSNLEVGTELPRAPGESWHLGGQYTLGLSSADLIFRLDYHQVGDFFFDINEQDAGAEGSYSLIDARVAYGAPSWDLAIWGKNLGDEEYRTHVQSVRDSRAGLSQIGNPRTYGVTFTYHFGE
jgi:iron complex outermembrane receptor protein